MPIYSVQSSDPRLAPFTKVQSTQREDRILIEGEFAVQRLLDSELSIHAILATPTVAQRLHTRCEQVDIFSLAASDLKRVAGYAFHRGCMASASRPKLRSLIPEHRSVIAVGLSDPLNIGTIIRNIRAFGASGLWLGPRCADPFSRRATRASMGHNLSVPVYRLPDATTTFKTLQQNQIACIAAALSDVSVPLPQFTPPRAWTLWVGNEGHGLSDELIAQCSHTVQIPMAPDCDSVNVATASGIFLYAMCQT